MKTEVEKRDREEGVLEWRIRMFVMGGLCLSVEEEEGGL